MLDLVLGFTPVTTLMAWGFVGVLGFVVGLTGALAYNLNKWEVYVPPTPNLPADMPNPAAPVTTEAVLSFYGSVIMVKSHEKASHSR
jgi:hypothetical protein